GMFVNMEGKKTSDASDGLSNVIMVGESSAPVLNAVGGTRSVDVQGVHGINMGHPNLITFEYWASVGGTYDRPFNCNTIAYPPNAPAIANNSAWPGIGDNYGANKPLNSNHTGGVHVLFGDGGARFIQDNINMVTYRRLCTRDDNQPTGNY